MGRQGEEELTCYSLLTLTNYRLPIPNSQIKKQSLPMGTFPDTVLLLKKYLTTKVTLAFTAVSCLCF